jgi:hypothetical protein
MKNRAQRRADRKKFINRTLHHEMALLLKNEEDRLYWALRHYQHRAGCSCVMCGNPRRYGKGEERFPIAERRQKDRENDSFDLD